MARRKDFPGGGPVQVELTISALNVAFDTGSLSVPAAQEVTIKFVNNDDAIPHNLHISGPGGFDVKTDIFTGSDGRSRDLVFPATEAGTYAFVCDVHPVQMTGTVTVE
jgi:plastocyanin